MLQLIQSFRSKIYKNFMLLLHKEKPLPSAIELNSLVTAEIHWSDPSRIKKFFSKSIRSFHESVIELLSVKCKIPEEKKIADIGCGTGQFLKMMSEKFSSKQCYGFDFSLSALKVAQKVFPDGIYHQYNIYEPMKGEFFLVTCTEVLEHLLDPEIALRNLIGAAVEGGWIFITVPDGRKDHFEGHINFWSPESWERFIQKHAENCRYSCGKIGKQNLYALLQKTASSIEQPM